MATTTYASSPCLLGENNPDIDPAYFGIAEHKPMKILASNTILYCSKWQEMETFYKNVMNFGISFQKDDWFIEFIVHGGSHLSIADEKRCTIASSKGTGVTLSFLIADLTAQHARLTSLGVKATEIKSQGWRAPYFYIWDPEGNRIEMWSRHV